MWRSGAGWNISGWSRGSVAAGFSPTSAESSAFLARATGITLDADKTKYDTMITGLVTDAVWAKLDALYIFAAPNVATAKLNLKSVSFPITSNGTNVDTTGFSAYHGYTGDGSTRYLNTGFVPTSAGGNFAQDSGSIGFYTLTTGAPTNWPQPMGSNDTVNGFADFFYDTTGINVRMNTNPAGTLNVAKASTEGLFIATRTGTNSAGLSINGAAPATSSAGSRDMSTVPAMYILATNQGGTATAHSSKQMSAVIIGGALTNPNIASLAARINAFMTSYGINVY